MSGRGRGRGAYYKARHGGGQASRGGSGIGTNSTLPLTSPTVVPGGTNNALSSDRTWSTLKSDLNSIDGQQYGAYNRLRGAYRHSSPDFTLSVDHVQGDAYASPSRVKVRMEWDETGFPNSYAASEIRAIALADYLTRHAAKFISQRHMNDSLTGSGGGWSGPKGGAFNINAPAQEILPRTSAVVIESPKGSRSIELRFTVSLPARGRTVLGNQALTILGTNLADLVQSVLIYSNHDALDMQTHIESAENQEHLRSQLAAKGLIAFIANGSILPRASGASRRPLEGRSVVPFQSPPSLEVTLSRVHGPDVKGMGIPKGITLLTGGGYHGKSTLLEALELGIYNHIPGDGRELIVTDPDTVKIRAEDGRSVNGTNITPFIKDLPGGKDTSMFTTDDASGSTSMAANIQEALEVGCQTLMIDEDSSATNLLVRDERMQALICNEPITPLVSKVRALYEEHGVSTIIVVGGLGDWLSVADRVIGMESYVPRDLTKQAEELVQRLPRSVTQEEQYGPIPTRRIHYPSSVTQGKTPWAKAKEFVILPSPTVRDASEGDKGIDISDLDQLVEVGQTKLMAHTLPILARSEDEGDNLALALSNIESRISINKRLPTTLVGGDFVAVRKYEMSATISRIRGATASPGVAALSTRKKARIDIC